METFDAITIAASTLALGVVLGYKLGNKDAKREYTRGRLDERFEILYAQLINALAATFINRKDDQPSRESGNSKAIH